MAALVIAGLFSLLPFAAGAMAREIDTVTAYVAGGALSFCLVYFVFYILGKAGE